MRFLLTAILTAYSGLMWASHIKGAELDSLYNLLSDEEKVRQLVWLKVDNDLDFSNLSVETIQAYGGIYLSHPYDALDEYIYNRGFIPSLAIQLDDRLNPAPENLTNLPSLTTLASIRDEQLLTEYFAFLKQAGQSFGANYLVLPDPESLAPAAQDILAQLLNWDDKYFISRGQIQFQEVQGRKGIKHLFGEREHWAVSGKELDKTDRLIEKHGDKVVFDKVETVIKQSIVHKYSGPPVGNTRKLPNKLAVAIGRASIIPLQKTTGILPLDTDTICLVTNDPFGNMAAMLSNYAYLITTQAGVNQSHAPVIVDDTYRDLTGYELADRKIIFLGELEKGLTIPALDAALFTSTKNDMYSHLLPQLLFGAADASGVMPITNTPFDHFSNDPIKGRNILGYAPAEIAGIDSAARVQIKEIVKEAISIGATPGCQIGIAVGGSIMLEESYGHLTYDSLIPTDKHTLYDLASVTKVAATLLAIMKLYEEGEINLDDSVKNYLPQFEGSNKAGVTIRQLLSHNAGLISYVPFWKRTLGGPERMEIFYYDSEEDEASDKRSYGLRPSPEMKDSLNNWIVRSPLTRFDSLPGYRYSDIGFMILHQLVEEVTCEGMDEYLYRNFYAKLGLQKLDFNPMDRGANRFEIAPTEYDYYFRDEQVWGQVHDRNAAVFGGVAGHAGLFSNTHDLLILMQMLAQEGQYGGYHFFKPETIAYFNQQYFPGNRRALGWDKKGEKVSNASDLASAFSFGHTGFTGTLVWVDPAYDLVFVFLSNRIYPDANNYKLIKNDIRTRVQDVVYEAILAKWLN